MSFYRESVISVASLGANTIVAADATKSISVRRLVFVVGGEVTVTIKSGSTALTGPMQYTNGGGLVLDFDEDHPWFVANAGEALVFDLSAAVQVSGRIWYS